MHSAFLFAHCQYNKRFNIITTRLYVVHYERYSLKGISKVCTEMRKIQTSEMESPNFSFLLL